MGMNLKQDFEMKSQVGFLNPLAWLRGQGVESEGQGCFYLDARGNPAFWIGTAKA